AGSWLTRAGRETGLLLEIDCCPAGEHQDAGTLIQWPGRRPGSGLTASDVMLPCTAAAQAESAWTVHQAIQAMMESGRYALPVVDESRVTGIVTLAGLARSLQADRGAPSIRRVVSVMRPPAVVALDTPVSEVRAILAADEDTLVVVCGPRGNLAGVVTARGLLAHEPGPG